MSSNKSLGGLEESINIIPTHIRVVLEAKHDEAIRLGADSGLFMGLAYRALIYNMANAVKTGTPDLAEKYLFEINHANGGNADKISSFGYIPK